MASIIKHVIVHTAPRIVWDALRDIGALHTRLVPGFVTDTRLEPDGRARIVTFANGVTARELIVSIDDDHRRVAWSSTGGRLTHHNASAQVVAEPDGSTRFIWTADLLPDEMAPAIAEMMQQGLAVIAKTLGDL